VVGDRYACASTIDDTVACWGEAAARWWGAAATSPWPTVTQGRGWTGHRRFEAPQDCRLEDRQVRCLHPSPFGSPTAPSVVLDDIDAFHLGEEQSCAVRGSTALCFGQWWLGAADEGPGVARLEAVDLAMTWDDVLTVDTAHQVHWFRLGREVPFPPLEAVQVAIGSDVMCARSGDARVWCWDPATDEPLIRPLAVPPGVAVERLEVRSGGVCLTGSTLCADPQAPLDAVPIVVERAEEAR
jgi:hypothetical protein